MKQDMTHILLATPIEDEGEQLNAIRILAIRDLKLGPPPRITIAYQLGRINKANGSITGFREVKGYETMFEEADFPTEFSEFIEVLFKHAGKMIKDHSESEVAVEDAQIASATTRKADVEAENIKRAEDNFEPLPVPEIPEKTKHSFDGTFTLSDEMAARVPTKT